MTKYAKLINNQIQYPPKNKGSIINYDLDIDLLIQDGYKEFIEVERPETIRLYHIEYVETNVITETIVYDETEEEAIERLRNDRENQFKRDFFQTSLGWIRRSVNMNEGQNKDFLSDLLPVIAMGVNAGQEVKIIAYNEPDYSQDIEDWTELQHIETVTSQFIQECFTQLSNDFIPEN